jgi:predicted dehydrogenase
MDKLRVAFIGAGRHANASLYPSLRLAPIEVVALCALPQDEEKARQTARLFGVPKVYLHVDDLLRAERNNIDACLVAVQPPDYFDLIQRVLAAGLPVFCEKPAAGSVAQARALEDAAGQAGIAVQVGFMKRHAAAYRLARTRMNAPDFGSPSSFYGKFVVGGGLYPDEYTYLVDNPIHLVDLARYFMGEVADVKVQRAEWPGKSWSYAASMRFESGAVGLLNFATTQSWRQHNEYAEITGAGHFVTVDNVVRYRHYPPEGPGEAWEPNFTVPADRNNSLLLMGYAAELAHFAEVAKGAVAPLATLTDARRALELIDQIYVAGGGVLDPGKTAGAW